MKLHELLNEFAVAFKKHCGEEPWPALLNAFEDGMNAQYRSGAKREKMMDDRFYQLCGNIAFPEVPEMATEVARLLKACFLLGGGYWKGGAA